MFGGENAIDDHPLFLREAELAHRWRLSPRSWQRRRKDGAGPTWLNFGGRIVYAIEDVREWERSARGGPEGGAK